MVISSLILPWLLRRRGWVHGQFIPNVAQSLKLIYFCLASPAAFVKLPIVPARAATKPPYGTQYKEEQQKKKLFLFCFFIFSFFCSELRCKLRVSRFFFPRPFPAATAAASSCVIEWSLRFDIRSGRSRRCCCCVIMFEHDIHDWQFTYSQQLADETRVVQMYEKRVVISPLFAPPHILLDSRRPPAQPTDRNITSQSRMTMTTESNYYFASLSLALKSSSSVSWLEYMRWPPIRTQ